MNADEARKITKKAIDRQIAEKAEKKAEEEKRKAEEEKSYLEREAERKKQKAEKLEQFSAKLPALIEQVFIPLINKAASEGKRGIEEIDSWMYSASLIKGDASHFAEQFKPESTLVCAELKKMGYDATFDHWDNIYVSW